MYYLLSLFSGLLISVMIYFNGILALHYGIYTSTLYIHLSGFVLITAIVLITRARPFAKRHAWYLYLGGMLGVLTIVFNNVAFGRISVSALLALVLLGQTVSGLAIDQVGWIGMPRHPFNKRRIIGLLLTIAGIAVMIDRFDTVAVLLSFLAGFTIVLSRTLNAKLGELTTIGVSTFFNYLVGTVISILVFFALGTRGFSLDGFEISPDPFMYIGGFLGVCAILLSNILVTKIPAFYLTLTLFIGQVFMGIVIDALIAQEFSIPILIGGILVAAGLCTDLMLDRKKKAAS
jgi:transporter family-2 protein